jgi:RimJ/RimL family protein N-acetyltransferase
MGEAVLTTARLVLRKIGEDDLDPYVAALNTPAVMQHLGGVQPRSAIAEKHAKTQALFVREGFGFMLLFEQASGELVGHCGMKRVDHPSAPNNGDHEIGWLVREDRWRRGYAEEAVRAVIAWGFEAHGAPHVVALTSLSNKPSWRLMEKLGMLRRADLDFDDPAFPPGDNPTVQYALTRAQWETRE